MKNLIFFFMFFGLHQGLGLIMRLSVTGAWIFSFSSWLTSRLGLDYEALGNKGLSFGTMGWSCTRQLAIWMWNVRFIFLFFFGLHQGLGPKMKHSVTRAWILWLWVEAALGSWPYNCKKLDFLFHVFWLASRLGLDYEALRNENLNFFLFTFGFHQGLGRIMKLSVTGAWILGLWVEAAPVSWPCKCEKFDFLFHVFWLASRLGLDYEALGNGSLNFSFFSWLASSLGPDYEALGNESLNFGTLGRSCTS
jgi:hypothetical protein